MRRLANGHKKSWPDLWFSFTAVYRGYNDSTLNRILKLTQQNQAELLEAERRP